MSRCSAWVILICETHGLCHLNTRRFGERITPHCVAESDQRHAQHPLKMLGIDFSCGSYQTNSERIMLLNS